MSKITVGVVAHVDAGKTTLCESLLFKTGTIRSFGRIDDGTTCFDFTNIEKKHGITVFSKEARLKWKNTDIFLIDTPGHSDFRPETRRVYPILDAIVFVISATELQKPQNLAIFDDISDRKIPIIFFVSKSDVSYQSPKEINKIVTSSFSNSIILYNNDEWDEDKASLLSDDILRSILDGSKISFRQILPFILTKDAIPCIIGSGLKGTGVEDLLSLLCLFAENIPQLHNDAAEPEAFVYKVDYDGRGIRQTHVKILSGTYFPKSSVFYKQKEIENEKINEIRLLTGSKFINLTEARSGDVCVFTGLIHTDAGTIMGLPKQINADPGLLCYGIFPKKSIDTLYYFETLRKMEVEEPSFAFVFPDRENKKSPVLIHLNGDIQAEIFLNRLSETFGIDAELSEPIPEYRETIKYTSFGNGHFEPLRHYAEVRLKLSPLPVGSGIQYDSICPENILEKHWQSLIISQLQQINVPGILARAPLTDIRITLCSGRAHLKHTEGGDFREAAIRALRQGLMKTESVLLEPFVSFSIRCKVSITGKILTDLQTCNCTTTNQEHESDTINCIYGTGPLLSLESLKRNYARNGMSDITISSSFMNFLPAPNQKEILMKSEYNPELDYSFPCDSIFCSHGAGHSVKWNEADNYMHTEACKEVPPSTNTRKRSFCLSDDEFREIIKKEVGISSIVLHKTIMPAKTDLDDNYSINTKRTAYLIDGNNLLHTFIKKVPEENLISIEILKNTLVYKIQNWADYCGCNVKLVFDGFGTEYAECEKCSTNTEIINSGNNSADVLLERYCEQLGPSYQITMVTSDKQIQITALNTGITRMTCGEFLIILQSGLDDMRNTIINSNKELKNNMQNGNMEKILSDK